jgi:hypothetical protein
MGGEPVRHEPSNVFMLQQSPEVLEAFRTIGWLQYFERLQGYNNSISLEFSMNL